MNMPYDLIRKAPRFIPGASGVIPTLDNCYGYYNAQNDKGEIVGPLVGYAGTYIDDEGKEKNYVGYEYFNVAMAEQWPFILDKWADYLVDIHIKALSLKISAFHAAPLGGLAFAQALTRSYNARANYPDARYIYSEKRVLELATSTSREKSMLVMDRHIFLPGDRAVQVEDVTNNFSTTGKSVALADESGAEIERIITIINRAEQTVFVTADGRKLVVASASHRPTNQFRQDDPEIAELIKCFGLILKPKNVWMTEVMPYILKAKGLA